jgi:hypothetical protein
MGKLPIETVYAFEPVPAGATAEEEKLILGSEASLWTETGPGRQGDEQDVSALVCLCGGALDSPAVSGHP